MSITAFRSVTLGGKRQRSARRGRQAARFLEGVSASVVENHTWISTFGIARP